MSNPGNQTVTFAYRQELIASDFNKWLYNLIKAGVYNGGTLSIDAGNDILIAPMDVVCHTSLNQSVHIKTVDNAELTISEATPYVTCQYVWADEELNYMTFTAKAVGGLLSTDVVIGKGVYEVGVLTGFDYEEKTVSFYDNVTDLQERLTLIESQYPAGQIIPNMYTEDPAILGIRQINLIGQVIEIADYQRACDNLYCGDATNGTAPAFYKTSDAGGTLRDITGAYMVLPDSRGLSLKNIGNATINARLKTGPAELGSVQEDQMQGWQGGYKADLTGNRNYFGSAGDRDFSTSAAPSVNFTYPLFGTALQGTGNRMLQAMNDGTNGDPRTGLATRDSTLGTQFSLVY